MHKKILFEIKKGVGIITLNNPKKLNALDMVMIRELDETLEKIRKSKLKVVVVKSAGKSFCAGGDIYWEKRIGELSIKEAKKQIKFLQNTFSKIERLSQVFIALINGHAVGGGNELAMACDIRIALPSAKFIHPENILGTVAPLGGTKRLPRLIGLGRAKYMLFTGEMVDAKTAHKWGLVDFLIPASKVNGFLKSLLNKITKNPTKATELTKKSVNKDYIKDLEDDFEVESYVKCSRSKENKEILNKFLYKGKN